MPPLAGERWWRQPPKGECISNARRAVIWFSHGRKPGCEGFIQTGAFYNLKAPYNNPRAKGASNLSPLRTFGPAGRQPSSHKGACSYGASHQRGNAGVVHEVYDSLFFSSNFLFPLEGKCHVVAKGCTGQSNGVILYRYPDRQSAASLATSWSSPPCKQVALVLISAVVKAFS